MTTTAEVIAMLDNAAASQQERHLRPLGEDVSVTAVDPKDIPKTMAELGELRSYAYDLSVRAAGELKIPIAGGVSGGMNRRVVLYEWSRSKDVVGSDGIEYRYGYAIRFCLTVSELTGKANLNLSFLSAQAEMGTIQASWLMQVRGLTGTKIDEVVLPPQDLNVKTFVIAQQSLSNAIAAIHDSTTTFVPGVVLTTVSPAGPDSAYRVAAATAFAMYSVSRGRKRADAASRFASADVILNDTINDVYEFFDIKDPVVVPSNAARERARELLVGVEADT